MPKRDIIVIGGSAGGIAALQALVSGIPPQLSATIFVVLHTAPDSPGLLPEILSRKGLLPAQHAEHETRFEAGNIYIAPPNRHLLIDANGIMCLTHGPKENRFRPAIDPLFRSAALDFGARVVGILLSGGMDDGVAGLSAIKAAGGVVVVQDPEDAEVSQLPRNALAHVRVDYCLPAVELGTLIKDLAQGNGAYAMSPTGMPPKQKRKLEIEIR